MPLRTSLTIALAFGALGLMPKASASPYVVYSGKITTLSALVSTDDTALLTKLGVTGTNFHTQFTGLPVALQNKIHSYLSAGSGTLADIVYMVTDEADVSNYAVVVVDPTGSKVISSTVSSDHLTAFQTQNAFISGFKYTKISSKGGIGLFRFAFSHTTRNDPGSVAAGTPTTGSYVIQASATGPIDDVAGIVLVHARAAEKLRVVNAGVLVKTLSLPATVPIPLPPDDQFISSFTGTVQGYYFDDTSSSSIAGTTTAGTLSLVSDAVLTDLANNGGGYAASARYVGYIPPIMETVPPHNTPVSPATAFQTFINNIIAVYPNPVP